MSKSRRHRKDENLALRLGPDKARAILEDLANFIPGSVPRGRVLVAVEQSQLPAVAAKLGTKYRPPLGKLQLSEATNRGRVLVRRFPEIFDELHRDFARAGTEGYFLLSLIGLTEHIQRAWKEQDLRAREWTIYELRKLWQRFNLSALQAGQRREPLTHSTLVSQIAAESKTGQSEMISKAEQYAFWGWWPEPPPPLTAFEQLMVRFQRMLEKARYCANPECPAPYFFAQRRGQKYHHDCAWYGRREAKRRYWHETGKKDRSRKVKQKRRQ